MDAQQIHNIDIGVLLFSIDAKIGVDPAGKFIDLYISTVGDETHIAVLWQIGNHRRELLSDSRQLLLLKVDIYHEKIGVAMVGSFKVGFVFDCGVLFHEFVGEFVGLDMLGVVRG